MASVQKHRQKWRVISRKDGKRVQLKGGFLTQDDAIEWMQANVDGGPVKLADLIDAWQKAQATNSTRDAAARLARVLSREGWVYVKDITLASIAAYKARGWVHRELQALLTALRWGHEVHGYAVDPKVLKFKNRNEKPERPPPPLLTEEQVADIREAAVFYGERAMALVDYLLKYGARPITACRLIRDDIGLTPPSLRLLVKQKAKPKWVTHPILASDLERWLGLEAIEAELVDPHGKMARRGVPLFPHYKANRAWQINDRGMAQEVGDWYKNTVGKRARLPKGSNTIYRLKDHAVTRMLDAGLTLKQIADFTGHADTQSLQRYERSNMDRARNSLALLDPESFAKEAAQAEDSENPNDEIPPSSPILCY